MFWVGLIFPPRSGLFVDTVAKETREWLIVWHVMVSPSPFLLPTASNVPLLECSFSKTFIPRIVAAT